MAKNPPLKPICDNCIHARWRGAGVNFAKWQREHAKTGECRHPDQFSDGSKTGRQIIPADSCPKFYPK